MNQHPYKADEQLPGIEAAAAEGAAGVVVAAAAAVAVAGADRAAGEVAPSTSHATQQHHPAARFLVLYARWETLHSWDWHRQLRKVNTKGQKRNKGKQIY